jgi:hypothetical protein
MLDSPQRIMVMAALERGRPSNRPLPHHALLDGATAWIGVRRMYFEA